MATLQLGHFDQGTRPPDLGTWLQPFHSAMSPKLKNKLQFRDDANSEWRSFRALPGNQVRDLQRFLKDAGFFPKATFSGIFGYGTKSALRLFQEYVRQFEGQSSIGVPDGVLGPQTSAHIRRWKDQRKECHWKNYSMTSPSENYLKWLDVLQKARAKYLISNDPVINNLRAYPLQSDSLPPEEWTFRPVDTHLLGIRCQPEIEFTSRPNDDLFILLIKGMTFTFFGSTDPNPKMISPSIRDTEGAPFLTEGQHKYRFGWHKVSNAERIYQALRPYSKGVLVYRDRNNKNKLNKDDILNGFGMPNKTINIHWTPDADRNWSAGCQVISGDSYIDNEDRVRSCKKYAAEHYNNLSSSKTRGAYNLLSDLVISYSPVDLDSVWYTMGRAENLADISSEFGNSYIKNQLTRLLE